MSNASMSAREQYEKFFYEADADGNGFLTLNELRDVMKKKGYRGGDSQIKAFFHSIDENGDNNVSYEEYMLAMGQITTADHKAAAMRRCFRSFDKNGDGKIDRSELKAVLEETGNFVTQEELDLVMEEVDKDKSGTIEYEEFVDAVFKLKGKADATKKKDVQLANR